MDLILWRHAEAEEGVPDKARKLTAKGARQAQRMARWLEPRLPKTVRVITSPARRCVQTASALTEKFREVGEIGVGARAPAVLAAAGWPDARGAVLVVGHQPTLGQVAALLLAGEEDDWTVKKGGVWWLTTRIRDDGDRVVLRAVMNPDLA